MGVRGLTTLLRKRGIIPFDATGSYNDVIPSSPCAQQTEIKQNSNLAIDGSNLAFHIFRLAYYKHYQYISRDDQRGNFHDDVHLISNLIPSLVPLSIIESTTEEVLLQFLCTNNLNVRIYLNGNKRILKQRTFMYTSRILGDTWYPWCETLVSPQCPRVANYAAVISVGDEY